MHLASTPAATAVSDEVVAFLESPYRVRLEEIAKRMKEKDTGWAKRLLDGIEVWAHVEHRSDILEEILLVRKYARSPGASLKMLLEHLALSLSEKA